jgi:hypothetical protein
MQVPGDLETGRALNQRGMMERENRAVLQRPNKSSPTGSTDMHGFNRQSDGAAKDRFLALLFLGVPRVIAVPIRRRGLSKCVD